MRVLVLGAGGMLAKDVIAAAPRTAVLAAPKEDDLDVASEALLDAAFSSLRPDVVVNCAAYTNVDGAETNRELALRVNGEAPGIIGRVAARQPAGSRPIVLHISTDYVFDGKASKPYLENDSPSPLSVYGNSKLQGERALADSGAVHLIVRTSWLFGEHGRSFPRTMWQRARNGQATRVVNDQHGRPTATRDLARAIWGLVDSDWIRQRDRDSIIHVAGEGETTWYELAKAVFARAGVPQLLEPCTTSEYALPASRPAYSVLDTTRYARIGSHMMPHWRLAVAQFLDAVAAADAQA